MDGEVAILSHSQGNCYKRNIYLHFAKSTRADFKETAQIITGIVLHGCFAEPNRANLCFKGSEGVSDGAIAAFPLYVTLQHSPQYETRTPLKSFPTQPFQE